MPRRTATVATMRRLGARLRQLRMERDLTQESVAWACGITKGYLSQVESGQRLPSLAVIFALAKHLEVQAADLLCLDLTVPRLALLDAARREDRKAVRAHLKRLGL